MDDKNDFKPVCIKALPCYNVETNEKKLYYLFCLKVNKSHSHYFLSSDRMGENIVEDITLQTSKEDLGWSYKGLGNFNITYPEKIRIIDNLWFSENTKIFQSTLVYQAIVKKRSSGLFSDTDASIQGFSDVVTCQGTLFAISKAMRETVFLFKPNNEDVLYTVSNDAIIVNGVALRVVNLCGSKVGFHIGLVGLPAKL